MKNNVMKYLIVFIILTITSCNKDGVSPNERIITKIDSNMDLYDDKTYTVKTDINDIRGSIYLGGNTTLIIEKSVLNFNLSEDLEYGIYLEDNAKIIIRNSTLKSNNKMWEFELRNNAKIDVKASFLKNHSAVKLFNKSSLLGVDSLIEELRMDHQGVAKIENCTIYPNMQFFFKTETPIELEFPNSYTPVDFLIDNSSKGGWKLDMRKSTAQGWQVDVKPEVNMTIKNSEDVTLALWSDGNINNSMSLTNPSDIRSSFTITEFGSTVNIINTEVFFINLYLKGKDNLTITGEKEGGIYNTKFLEILLVDEAQLTIHDSHIFGQLFHINDNSKVTLHNSLVGSDDPNDPINSEFAINNNSHAFAFDCEMTNTDIVIKGTSKLELNNCNYNALRLSIFDNGEIITN